MTPNYTHLIIDEDGTPLGTSNQEAVAAYRTVDTHLVIDIRNLTMEFANTVEPIQELDFNPADWEFTPDSFDEEVDSGEPT
jgi:hypothetical protein